MYLGAMHLFEIICGLVYMLNRNDVLENRQNNEIENDEEIEQINISIQLNKGMMILLAIVMICGVVFYLLINASKIIIIIFSIALIVLFLSLYKYLDRLEQIQRRLTRIEQESISDSCDISSERGVDSNIDIS